MAEKARYWTGVLYTENMIEDWEMEIGDIVQIPYAYCVHNDIDEVGEHRKEHVHLILVFSNTTTYNHAFKVFDKLSAAGRVCVNKIESVINIRQMYEYLIHNTETCAKKGKKLYDLECRITGNNFDIGSYEQVSMAEKNAMCLELCEMISKIGFTNFTDFYIHVMSIHKGDMAYFEIMKSYSGLFERLTKGNFQKLHKLIYTTNTTCFNKKAEEEELPFD